MKLKELLEDISPNAYIDLWVYGHSDVSLKNLSPYFSVEDLLVDAPSEYLDYKIACVSPIILCNEPAFRITIVNMEMKNEH